MASLRLLIVIACATTILAEIEMEFTKWPESVTAPAGDVVTFECTVRVPGERLAWRWKPVVPDDASWIDLPVEGNEKVSSRLVVEVKEDMQPAFYQCVVWYGAVSLASVPGRLAVARVDLSGNLPEKRVVTAPLRNNLVLHCRAPLSEPPAVLNWWKDEKDKRKQLDTPHGVLTISNASSEDSGLYGCTATNELSGQVIELPERTFLKVQHEGRGGNRFLENEEYVGTIDNDGVLTTPVPPNGGLRLWCGVVGTPQPGVTWHRDGGALPTRAKKEGGQLFINPFRVEDEGVYTCSSGGNHRSWRVYLLQPAHWDGTAGSVNGTEGGGARVSCGTPLGAPPPQVYWLLNAVPISGDLSVKTTVLVLCRGLVAEACYKCRRSHILCKAAEMSREQGAPMCLCFLDLGKAFVSIPREALWTVLAKISWPEKYMSVFINHLGSELYIEHVEKRHAGIVQCFACNDLGCAYDAALLTVMPVQISDQEYSAESAKNLHFPSQPPKRHSRKNSRKHKPILVPPSRPNVTRMSDESVMLAWSNSTQGLAITFFKVQYREAANSSSAPWHTESCNIPPYIHSYEVTGLKPDKYYKFRIAAVYSNQDNKQGRSSAKFYLQRGPFRSPRAPVLVKATPLSPYTVMLNWTWSTDTDINADGFYIHFRDVSSAGEYEKAAVDSPTRSLVLTHLVPDTTYEVKVQAFTEQAPSEFTSILTAKTLRLTSHTSSTTEKPRGDEVEAEGGSSGALATAGGAAAVVVALLGVALLLCRRARRLHRTDFKEKGSVPEGGVGGNGYIPAKVPITITANPMHAEQNGDSGDSGVEMSYMHNNNTGGDDAAQHARKNGTRQYV